MIFIIGRRRNVIFVGKVKIKGEVLRVGGCCGKMVVDLVGRVV